MPEGHSIHKLAREWNELEGQTLRLSSPQERFSAGAAALTGRTFVGAEAHGKHLFVGFEGQEFIHVHLGLYGRFEWHDDEGEATAPRDSVRLRAEYLDGWVDLVGPTRCDHIDATQKQTVHDRLGVDPLRPQDDISEVLDWLRHSPSPLGAVLLDQSVIAGIGNVYRAEILFLLGWSPHRATESLTDEQWTLFWEVTRQLLREGVRRGRIVTTAQTIQLPEAVRVRTHCASRTYTYARAGDVCVRCGDVVVADEVAGRRMFWCPGCQK